MSQFTCLPGVTRSLGLALVFACADVAAVPLDDSLEGYWSFGGAGTDLSGNARDLTVSSTAGYAGGVLGQGLSLPGNESANASRATDDAVFDFGANDFTVQIWVDFASMSGEQTLIEKFTGGAGPGWTLTKLANNNLRFFGQGALNLDTNCGCSTLSDPGFHQIIVRRTGSTFDILLDNTLFATGNSAGAISDTANGLLIGARDGAQNFPVNGVLDEVGIWSRALDNSDIAALYNGGQGLSPISAAVSEPAPLSLLAVAFVVAGLRRARQR